MTRNRVLSLKLCGAAVVLGMVNFSPANASLVSWNPVDNTADGVASGTFVGGNVGLTSTDGPVNGGRSQIFGGFYSPAGVFFTNQGAAFDWNEGEAGFLRLDFDVAVKDPVFAFSFLDGDMSFDFDDSLSLTIVGTGTDPATPAGADVTLLPDNIVRTTGHINKARDAFGFKINGTISSLELATNIDLGAANSVLVQMDVEPAPPAAVPEPGAGAVWGGLCLTGLMFYRRRVRRTQFA